MDSAGKLYRSRAKAHRFAALGACSRSPLTRLTRELASFCDNSAFAAPARAADPR
jgi:hypothetical protein